MIKNNKTTILMGKNKEMQVVTVLHATNPISNFSTKLYGVFMNFAIKKPKEIKRKMLSKVDKKNAIIENIML